MTAGLLAGCLTAVLLSCCRVRPDHRLREATLRSRVPRRRLPLRLPTRRRPPGAAELAAWCDALAREVRAGAALGAALRVVEAPAGTPLSDIRHALTRGTPLVESLAVDVSSPDQQAALTVLTALAHHGGSAAQPLDQVAATLRRRAADAAERSVHSSQARLSALVMTVLPGAVLTLLLVTSPSVRSTTGSPFGAVIVGFGAFLNGLGWLWMRRIVAGRSR